ncbi:MAG: DUF2817 domain-containing protein [Phycisphaerales bacterium]|nr:DUF2817 domain-containing protein [Phycisphaerales bacterium]
MTGGARGTWLCIAACAAASLFGGCAGGGNPSGRPAPGVPSPSAAAWSEIGRSVEGRPIEAISLGAGPRRVLIIGGIHGDETEGTRHVDALVDDLRRDAASGETAEFTLVVIRQGNPDGAARGTRENARGVDLNRNWPARNFAPSAANGPAALSEPETRAMHGVLLDFRPGVVLVLHASHNGPFVNFDGDGGRLADAFAQAAGAGGARWRVVPSMGYPTPGSLGSWFGVDGRGPILTIEFRRGDGGDEAREALCAGVRGALRDLRRR